MSRGLDRRRFLTGAAAASVALCFRPGRAFAAPAVEASPEDGLEIRWRSVSLAHLPRLEEDFERVMASGQPSDDEVFRSYIADYSYVVPEDFPEARSVVVVALPDLITHVDFVHEGEVRRVTIPAGYVRTPPTLAELEGALRSRATGDPESRFVRANLPLKLLAARTGLGDYGRNNILYVDGLGSNLSLIAFFTDHEFTAHSWRAVRMLRECRGCDRCIRRCPTRCIDRERFVVDVGRCVTLFNERGEAMPEWIDPAAHNALVGCCRCQDECPANLKEEARTQQLARIEADETAALLDGVPEGALIESVRTKLAAVGLVADLVHLGRNLQLVLEARPS